MLNILLLLASTLAHANAACPDLSGIYSERDNFLYEIKQTGCGKLTWTSTVHPKNPSPPAPKPPETDKFLIDCQKHQDFFQMDSYCFNKEILERWVYSKDVHGKWNPFMIRRLSLDGAGNLHDDLYATDSSGAEEKYSSYVYTRQNP